MKKKKTNEDIVSDVRKWFEESEGRTTTWENNQVKWHKLRMRIKKKKTVPFPDCSNIRMPTAEIQLKKVKSAEINRVYGIRPVVQGVPTPSGSMEDARTVEKFMDHLIMDVIKCEPKSIILSDQKIEKGFMLGKPYWRLETTTRDEEYSLDDISIEDALWLYAIERTEDEVISAIIKKADVDMHQFVAEDNREAVKKAAEQVLAGKTKVKFSVDDVLYSFPDVEIVSPEHIRVPTDSGYDTQSCEYIIHEFYKPLHYVELMAQTKDWDTKTVSEIASYDGYDDKLIDTVKDMREGIERLNSDGTQVKLWECYCWYDLKGDGNITKCVITIAPEFSKLLKKRTIPFYSGKWPFVKFFYELTEDRWFSHRGLVEIIEDIIKEIDVQHMQKIDNQTIRNMPGFLYRAGQVNTNAVQFNFGWGLPVSSINKLDDVMKSVDSHNPSVEMSYDKEQMILEAKVAELVGHVDFTLQSMINKREPRTKGEVDYQVQNYNVVVSLDSRLSKMQHEELFNWLWELWLQYGDDEYTFMYFGDRRWEKVKISKEQLQGKVFLKLRGNDQNTNPQVRYQKARAVLDSQNNPVAVQMGVITPTTMMNAYKRFYQELQLDGAEELYAQPQPKPESPQKQTFPKFADMTDGEKAQMLKRIGIQPDIQGRSLNKQREIQDKQLEHIAELSK